MSITFLCSNIISPVVLVELRQTWKVEIRDRDEAAVVLVKLHLTWKAELSDVNEASVILVELCLTWKLKLRNIVFFFNTSYKFALLYGVSV